MRECASEVIGLVCMYVKGTTIPRVILNMKESSPRGMRHCVGVVRIIEGQGMQSLSPPKL